MEFLKNWVLGITICSIIISIILSIAPNGNLQKTLKLSAGIVFILFFISPFVKGIQLDPDYFNVANTPDADFSEVFIQNTNKLISNQINEYLINDLENQGFNVYSVNTLTEGSSENIKITSITLKCSADEKEEIKKHLENNLKIVQGVINYEVVS